METKQRLMIPATSPPATAAELSLRARELTGLTIGALAEQYHVRIDPNPIKTKGLMGQLLECALGADAKSRAEPDFTQLGIELKTIPVNHDGKPQESTYLCVAPTMAAAGMKFEETSVYRKFRHMLWVPIVLSDAGVAAHRIGAPFLWEPSSEQLAVLRSDWEEHMERISMGEINQISAHQGVYLQIRPKAANNRARRMGMSVDGTLAMTMPRGFYLRARFTALILQEQFW